MTCSIINERVQLTFTGKHNMINLVMGSQPSGAARRSAMQHPDIRRAELAAMLRKYMKRQQSQKSQTTYWRTFIAAYTGKNANSNHVPATAGNDS